jgi:hypothetical protein
MVRQTTRLGDKRAPLKPPKVSNTAAQSCVMSKAPVLKLNEMRHNGAQNNAPTSDQMKAIDSYP